MAPTKKVKIRYIDNETFESDFYKHFPNLDLSMQKLGRDGKFMSAEPLQEAPESIQNKENIACDHGGLVIGSFLNVFGNQNPVEFRLLMKAIAKTNEEDELIEKLQFEQLNNSLKNRSQWAGFAGTNMEIESGFLRAQKQFEQDKDIDLIGQSYVWQQSEEGLIDEEIVRNSYFYLPAKQTPLSKSIRQEIEAVEQELPLASGLKARLRSQKSLVELLTQWRKDLITAKIQNPNESWEGIYLNPLIQKRFKEIANKYKPLKGASELGSSLHRFCERSLMVLENLEPTSDNKHLKCIEYTNQWRKTYSQKHPTDKNNVFNLIKMYDDENIGVFTAESLQNYYHTFVHSLEGQNNDLPLPRQEDERVSLLAPHRTILFDNLLKNSPVPESYHGLKSICNEERGGVSAMIPKIAALFAIARTIDDDIRPQEFCEIALRSGNISVVSIGDKQYGGVLVDKEILKHNVSNWATQRQVLPVKYKDENKIERKRRESLFKKAVQTFDDRKFTLIEYGVDKMGNITEKEKQVFVKSSKMTTYKDYYTSIGLKNLSLTNVHQNTGR